MTVPATSQPAVAARDRSAARRAGPTGTMTPLVERCATPGCQPQLLAQRVRLAVRSGMAISWVTPLP